VNGATFGVTANSRGDWHRNIVTLRRSVDLLARFADTPDDLQILLEYEAATKPATGVPPVIRRPFEEPEIYDPSATAIRWPFDHPCRSRYSEGRYGVWYGARGIETTVRETVHHFRRNTLMSAVARSGRAPIVQERRVHLVHCRAMLVDLRAQCEAEPRLVDPDDYAYCQALGAELRGAAQPGVLTMSVRHPGHEVAGVFDPDTLSHPRTVCHYTYRLDAATGRVVVERAPRQTEIVLDP
jgi:hypothetical protein